MAKRAGLDIETYNQKRDFSKTKEPRGRKLKGKGDSFVVQKHDATRLHYDFRLELDGVLLSWAVPKGPRLDPGENRLAMRTEDHPLDYGEFEGTIPKGEYGGGTVMLWDKGRWIPDPRKDPKAKPLEYIGWKAFRRMVGNRWDPGANVPFDPVAAKMAERIGLEVKMIAGRDLGAVGRALDGKPFKGTTIG